MKIGIIVYSNTGNTFSVSEMLKEELENSGNVVNIERILIENNKEADLKKIVITNSPNVSQYDLIIFASPVNAFTLAAAFKAYLNNLPSLINKKVLCFVTMFFPFKCLGGNRAINFMKNSALAKDGEVLDTDIINWSKKNRQQQIINLIQKFNSCIKQLK